MTGYDFGDRVTGVVADETDWGTSGPRIARPRREITGDVVGLYSAAADVATVETDDGERYCVRVTGRARATTAELLGADPDWCGGLSIDDYMAEQRRDRYDDDSIRPSPASSAPVPLGEPGQPCPAGCDEDLSLHSADLGCWLCDCIYGRPAP